MGCVLSLVTAALVATIVILVLGPCYAVDCGNGECDTVKSTQSQHVCNCMTGWAGNSCSTEIQVKVGGNMTTLSWAQDIMNENDHVRLHYAETGFYPDEIVQETTVNHVILQNLKPRTNYHVTISNKSWDQVYTEVARQQHFVTGQEQEITWTVSTNSSFGYLVSATRIQKQKQGFVTLNYETKNVTLHNLDPCTAYGVQMVKINNDQSALPVGKVALETACVVGGWKEASSVLTNGWNGGTKGHLLSNTHCNQPDSFPSPLINPSCTANQNSGNVGEAVTSEDAHTGVYSWHYKRGHHPSSHGQGCPFSPALGYHAGANGDGQITSVDGFYASFWIKAANNTGDNSSIEVAGGDNDGTDRKSTMIFFTAFPSGLEIRTFDCEWEKCTPYRNCSSSWLDIYLARDLVLSDWHHVEIEYRTNNTDYSDVWTYKIDEKLMYEGGAYLSAYYTDRSMSSFINRLKFKPRHTPNDTQFQGFLFDDIYYEVFNWADRSTILDYYETSFEA